MVLIDPDAVLVLDASRKTPTTPLSVIETVLPASVTMMWAKRSVMDAAKKARLASRGYHETTVTEFLGLTPRRRSLDRNEARSTQRLRESRRASGATQAELLNASARANRGSQKWRPATLFVSFDLLIRSLLAIGATPAEIGRQIASRTLPRPAEKIPAVPRPTETDGAGKTRVQNSAHEVPSSLRTLGGNSVVAVLIPSNSMGLESVGVELMGGELCGA